MPSSKFVKAVTRLASALFKSLLLNPDDAEYVMKPAMDLRATGKITVSRVESV